eukprot:17284_1
MDDDLDAGIFGSITDLSSPSTCKSISSSINLSISSPHLRPELILTTHVFHSAQQLNDIISPISGLSAEEMKRLLSLHRKNGSLSTHPRVLLPSESVECIFSNESLNASDLSTLDTPISSLSPSAKPSLSQATTTISSGWNDESTASLIATPVHTMATFTPTTCTTYKDVQKTDVQCNGPNWCCESRLMSDMYCPTPTEPKPYFIKRTGTESQLEIE